MIKITPCIICFYIPNELDMVYYENDKDATRQVTCKGCGLRGPYGYSNEVAIKRWNTLNELRRNKDMRKNRDENVNDNTGII